MACPQLCPALAAPGAVGEHIRAEGKLKGLKRGGPGGGGQFMEVEPERGSGDTPGIAYAGLC